MIESAESSTEQNGAPVFLVLSDLWPHDEVWPQAQSQMEDVRLECARVLGFDPDVRLKPIDEWDVDPVRETFLIPAAFDFSLWERESLGQRIAALRQRNPEAVIHHDDV